MRSSTSISCLPLHKVHSHPPWLRPLSPLSLTGSDAISVEEQQVEWNSGHRQQTPTTTGYYVRRGTPPNIDFFLHCLSFRVLYTGSCWEAAETAMQQVLGPSARGRPGSTVPATGHAMGTPPHPPPPTHTVHSPYSQCRMGHGKPDVNPYPSQPVQYKTPSASER